MSLLVRPKLADEKVWTPMRPKALAINVKLSFRVALEVIIKTAAFVSFLKWHI